MKRNLLALAGLLWCCSMALQAQSDSTYKEKLFNASAGGYVKYLHSASWIARPVDLLISNNLLHHRLNLKASAGARWTGALELRNRLFWGEEIKLNPGYAQQIDQYNGLADLSLLWSDGPNVVMHSIIDRAYADYTAQHWGLRLGRQRINWGINTVWTPNDLFNAFNYLDFDYEERPGSDALRLSLYPGMMSSVEVAVAPMRAGKESVAAALYRTNFKGYDIQSLAGYYRGDLAIGGGWAGNIGGASFKGEFTGFLPTEASADSVAALSLSVSSEYKFKDGAYLIGSMLYNSAGPTTLSGGLQAGLAAAPPSARNLFPARWAFFAGAFGSIGSLFSINGGVMYSPASHLTLLFPTLSYSIASNWDLDFIAQAFLFDDGSAYRFQGSGMFLRLRKSY